MRLVLGIALVAASFGSFEAAAYPEMVRHAYANCTACHVSPNGGGVLTQYGRALSSEALSTWGTEQEGQFLYGALMLPDWLNLGGDVRAVQTYQNTPRFRQGKFILMQADLEAAAQIQKWRAVATLGYQEKTSFNKAGGPIFSRRHWVGYQATEEISVRAGRFQTAFGINDPNHYIATKRPLGWDEGSETYNLEGSYLGEKWDAFATIQLGRPDATALGRDEGFALRSSQLIGETNRVGGSYLYGSSPRGKRHLIGPYAILGLTHHFFVLAEVDFQRLTPPNGDSRWGMVNYLRVNYEFIKGLHGFVTQEYTKLDFRDPKGGTEAYGLGVQWFPRPHFEIYGMYQKQKIEALGNTFMDFAYVMLHAYL